MDEKKTMKERFESGKAKVKDFWEKNKVTIIKGTVATALTVGGIVLYKKAANSLTIDDVTNALPDGVDQNVETDNSVKAYMVETLWKENDMDEVRNSVDTKLREIHDICSEKDVVVNISTGLGGSGESFEDNWCWTQYYADETCIGEFEQPYRR